jgi:glycogen(starch) synthase
LRILVVSNLYPPACLGGYELACKEVVDGLRAKGHDVCVLTSTYGASCCPAETDIFRIFNHYWGTYPDGTLVLNLPQAAKSNWLDFTNYRRMKKWIREFKPEFIYLWNLERISPVPIIAAVKKSGIPFVIHLMDYWLRDNRLPDELVSTMFGPMLKWVKPIVWQARGVLRRIIDPYVMENSMIAMSETVKREYVRDGFLPERIQVIYHGTRVDSKCDAEESFNKQGERKLFRILFAGALIRTKGVDTLILALSGLVHLKGVRDIHLDIVGQGGQEYVKKLHCLARQHQLDGFINFLGFVSREKLLTKYQEYDVFVLPTKREEPFGIVIVEAMASGVPVIASDIGGPAEIITNGETGILVPPGDSVKLAIAINHLMCDENLRRRIQSNALALVRDKFDVEQSIDQIEYYITDSVLEQGTGSSRPRRAS